MKRAVLSCLFVALIAFVLSGARLLQAETADDALVRANSAMASATAKAQADPAHPIFHITAPAQWINDPNGPIYHKGYYHMFYQLHPFSEQSGPKYWGHVRSRDLVKWEHLPIAIAPSTDQGESEIWSGCCTINGLGQPMAFYTSIGPDKNPFDHSDQWAAIGDDDLIHWHKSPPNPVLSRQTNEGKTIYDWRDPFVFHDKNKTFVVLGGSLNESKGGQAVANIYEAQNPELTSWKYRGVMFQIPDESTRTLECPNFFQLGDKWVLLASPYGKVQYFIGDFDAETCRFHPSSRGTVDFGPGFYAPNTMQVPDGRRLVWGWVNGFPDGHGWNGCLSLPRQLSISGDGQLKQIPAPQLEKLRGKESHWKNVHLGSEEISLTLPASNTIEISTEIDMEKAGSLMVSIGDKEKKSQIELKCDGLTLKVQEFSAPLPLFSTKGKMKLRIFLDRSVLEVFANDTVCITKTLRPLGDGSVMTLRTEGGTATAGLIQAWPMNSIW